MWRVFNHFVFHLPIKGAGADPKILAPAPDQILNRLRLQLQLKTSAPQHCCFPIKCCGFRTGMLNVIWVDQQRCGAAQRWEILSRQKGNGSITQPIRNYYSTESRSYLNICRDYVQVPLRKWKGFWRQRFEIKRDSRENNKELPVLFQKCYFVSKIFVSHLHDPAHWDRLPDAGVLSRGPRRLAWRPDAAAFRPPRYASPAAFSSS